VRLASEYQAARRASEARVAHLEKEKMDLVRQWKLC
jgi:hypothetical protein